MLHYELRTGWGVKGVRSLPAEIGASLFTGLFTEPAPQQLFHSATV